MAQPLNILMITCDQLRLDALGCYGNDVIMTPNIDALAKHGQRFDRVFAASPVCSPNRASIATGRYPTIHGLRDNGMVLPTTELTMMEVLRRQGYRTYGVGKMHFGPQWRYPDDRSPLVDPTPEMAYDWQPSESEYPWYGFDRVLLSEDNRVGPYETYLRERGMDIWDDPHSFTYPQHATVRSAFPEEHHQTTWVADRSMDLLEQHPDEQPFFMWTSFVHPHHPFNPPAPYDTMYDPADMPPPLFDPNEVERWPESYREKYFASEGGHEAIGMSQLDDDQWKRIKAYYYGMISLIDKQVGRLVEMLKRTGQLERTLIVFTADHGEMLGDHHLVFKGTILDCVSNVPLILCGPGVEEAGQASPTLGSSIDLMPTILDLVGVEPPESVQGVGLRSNGAAGGQRSALLIEHGEGLRVLRTDDALLGWRGAGQRGELYRIDHDPHCFKNLWDDPDHAADRDRLVGVLLDAVIANVDPIRKRLGPC